MSSRLRASGISRFVLKCLATRSLELFSCLAIVPIAEGFASAQTLSSPPFYKTSFDCAKAKELSVEAAICKNEDLAKLDLEMADAYRTRVESANSAGRGQIIPSQRRWLGIRNSYRINPYDPSAGELIDLTELYQKRISALKSSDPALLQTTLPKEYDWLRTVAPEGFSKDQFAISRGYAGCEDPCQKKPSLYRWISIGGRGIGEEPGDIDTPYAELLRRLAAQGWAKCREVTDDSGKQRVDRFRKNEKMVSVSRGYSMGTGNGIGIEVTISEPLPEPTPKSAPDPTMNVADDWEAYSAPEIGLKVRFPPDWHVRDASPPGGKYLMFAADDFKPGSFIVAVAPHRLVDPNYKPAADEPKCSPSTYQIAGFAAKECLFEDELYTQGTCTRYLQSITIDTGSHELTFEPSQAGSFPDASGHYKLTDLYEKIMGTIEIGNPKEKQAN